MQYATTQNNLGNAYTNLPEVRDKEANLKLAIVAFEEALRVHAFEAFPVQYASTQNNLGTAYSSMAEVHEREANLNLAIGAFREALRVFTFEALPQYCAATQFNLVRVYLDLGGARLAGGATEEAKDLFRAARNSCIEALRVCTKVSYPEGYDTLTKRLSALDALLAKIQPPGADR